MRSTSKPPLPAASPEETVKVAEPSSVKLASSAAMLTVGAPLAVTSTVTDGIGSDL